MAPSTFACPDRRRPSWQHTTTSLVWLLWVAQLVACNAILGFEEGSPQPAGTTSSTGGSGGGTGSEDCQDRVDNDDDGAADCEDSQCADSFVCAAAPPTDWTGVGWLYIGGRAPACSHGVVTELFDETELPTQEPVCDCACGDPDSQCWGRVRCGSGCGNEIYHGWPAPDCAVMTVLEGLSCLFNDLQTTSGSCPPTATIDTPEVQWEPLAWLCLQTDGGHCPGGELCIAAAESDGIGPCMARAGQHQCPAAFPHSLTYADGSYDDTRACSSDNCSCGSPEGGNCVCTSSPCGVEFYFATDCSDDAIALAPLSTGQCGVLPMWSPAGEREVGVRLVGSSIDPPQSCPPSGTAQPQGQVTAAGTITVCCAQDPG